MAGAGMKENYARYPGWGLLGKCGLPGQKEGEEKKYELDLMLIKKITAQSIIRL